MGDLVRLLRDQDSEITEDEVFGILFQVLLCAAANRDGDEFEHPEQLVIDRPNIKNHLGFGQGIHFCVGAALTRLETRVALEVFFGTTTSITFAITQTAPAYTPSLFIRRLASLDMQFT